MKGLWLCSMSIMFVKESSATNARVSWIKYLVLGFYGLTPLPLMQGKGGLFLRNCLYQNVVDFRLILDMHQVRNVIAQK